MSNNIGGFASQVASGIKNLVTSPHVAIANGALNMSKGIADTTTGVGRNGLDPFISNPIGRAAKDAFCDQIQGQNKARENLSDAWLNGPRVSPY